MDVLAVAPRYYIWHWHLKHELDERSQKELLEIPITGLFYRVGHFSSEGGSPYVKRIKKSFRFPEQFRALNRFEEIHLAYSFSNNSIDSFVKQHLNKFPDRTILWITEVIRQDYLFYKTLNPKVSGIQIDLEGGSVNFDLFKRLMAELDRALPNALLSITPMSSWHARKGIKDILKYVDLVVPMLYDFNRGRNAEEPLKVADWEWLPEVASKWEKLGTPVVYGVPTYSYCVVYDHNSRLKIPWALVDPDTASENRAFELPAMKFNLTRQSKFFSRDRVVDYQASHRWQTSSQVFNEGSRLKYNFVSSSALNQMLTALEASRGEHAKGYAFFRFGIPGEALVLDAWRIRRAVSGRLGRGFKLNIVQFKVESSVLFQIKNFAVPSYFGKTGLVMRFEGCKSKTADSSDFDQVVENDHFIEFQEGYLKPYELLYTSLMDCKDASSLKLEFNDSSGLKHERSLSLKHLGEWTLED